jgi:hypothetical protein
MKNKILRSISLIALICFSINASGEVLFSSSTFSGQFTPGQNIDLSTGWVINDYMPTWSSGQYAAMQFSISKSGVVDSVQLAITALADWSKKYSIQIVDDENGQPGVNVIWSATSTTDVPIYIDGAKGLSYSITTASGPAAEVRNNTNYWLYANCVAPCNLTWWADQRTQNLSAVKYINSNPAASYWSAWTTASAIYSINGAIIPVPEPKTWLLSAVALILIGAKKRRISA